MKTLARALILLDDDVAMLEDISKELKKCSLDEKSCLIQVAKELGFESWPDEIGIA